MSRGRPRHGSASSIPDSALRAPQTSPGDAHPRMKAPAYAAMRITPGCLNTWTKTLARSAR